MGWRQRHPLSQAAAGSKDAAAGTAVASASVRSLPPRMERLVRMFQMLSLMKYIMAARLCVHFLGDVGHELNIWFGIEGERLSLMTYRKMSLSSFY